MGFLSEAETIRYLNERTAASELVVFTSPPTKAADDGTEVVGGGYSRQAAPFAPATAGSAGRTGQVINDSSITIPNMPVAWDAIAGWGLAEVGASDPWFIEPNWTPTEEFPVGGNLNIPAGALVLYGEN